MPKVSHKKTVNKIVEEEPKAILPADVKTHNDDYIEIKLPKFTSLSKYISRNDLQQIVKGQYSPIFIVLLFIVAYILGMVTTHVQTTVQNTIGTITAAAQKTQ